MRDWPRICAYGTALSWTPDGNWIAYTGADKEPGSGLIAADGSNRRQRLIPGVMPAFSPNGRYLAFVRFNAGEESIYVLPLTPS